MISLGVAVLAAPDEPLSTCLESVHEAVDEIAVFTWDAKQAQVAAKYGGRIIDIPPARHVGVMRQEMQSALGTDWVLMLDPDEVAEPGATQVFRERAQAAGPDVVGLWVPYRMLFLGDELSYSFPSIKQMRLFRRGRVRYTRDLHNVPTPIEGRYDYLADKEPGLEHHFVTSLRHRFERHLSWAQVEAEELNQAGERLNDPIAILEGGLQEFKMYAVHRQGLRDGCKGLVNALMHSWKRIAVLCFLWEIQQAENMSIEPVSYWESILSELKIPRP